MEKSDSLDLNNISTRLRLIEERYVNLRRKIQIIEQNMISELKTMENELGVIRDLISELKKDIMDIREKQSKLSLEIGECVRRSDFLVLEKYIHLWDPMDFITREEAEEIISRYFTNKK